MSEATQNKWTYPFTKEDWELTPTSVKTAYLTMEQKLGKLGELKNRNSQNSSQPPSADGPYAKPKKSEKLLPKKPHGKPGGKIGHKGSRQQLLEPKEIVSLYPETCICGNSEFVNPKHYYTHQHIELPEIVMGVTHFLLHKGKCSCCGKMNLAKAFEHGLTG